jgi:hypothetical protein
MSFKLGSKAKCVLTGYRGTIVQASQHIGGLNQYELQSGLDKDGKWVDSKWFAENQLAAVKGDKPVAEETEAAPEAEDKAEEPAEVSDDDGGFGEDNAAPEAEDDGPTLDDVIEACQKHAKATGDRAKTQAVLLTKFKAKSVKMLKPEQYAAVIAALKPAKKK